jgi:Asp-tRNA(Asn)/Glu-tRNA(Gln) amidotransferase C subunit
MAKKSTKSKAAELKITAEELEKLQGLQQAIGNAVNNLANIEIAKHELLQDHASMKAAMRAFSEELQQKYGEVNTSLADGTITEPEAKEAPAMAPVE